MNSRGRLYVRFGLVATLMVFLLLMISFLACAAKETPKPAVPPAAVASPTVAPAATPTPPPVAAKKPSYGGNLRWAAFGNMGAVKTLDSGKPSGNWGELAVYHLLYEGLVEFDPDFNVIPLLAKSWDFSEGGKAVTFHLQEGVQFQDGTELNAEAVKKQFERVMNPDTGSRGRGTWEPLVERIEALDSKTVRFRLKSTSRAFMANMGYLYIGSGIASPAAVARYGDKFGANPVGTGPFVLKEWVIDDHLTVVRSEKYWDRERPYLDQITHRTIPDRSVAIAMLRTGEADYLNDVDARQVSVLKGTPGVVIEEYPSCNFQGYIVAFDRPPWNNRSLRQALAYSLDRQAFIDVKVVGMGRPAYNIVDDCVWWGDKSLKVYDYDPSKAREKLVEAGYPQGLEVKIWGGSSSDEIETAEIFQAQLAKVGIRVQIVQVREEDLWQKTVEGGVLFSRNSSVPRPDPDIRVRLLYHTNGTFNVMKISIPELDRLIDEAATIYDTAKAKPLYYKIQRVIMEEAASWQPLYFRTFFNGYRSNVKGHKPYPDTIPRIQNLWLER